MQCRFSPAPFPLCSLSPLLPLAILALAAFGTGSGSVTHAQLATGGSIKGGFKFPDYDRVSSTLKSLLTGRTARQQQDGTVHVTDLRVETYAYPTPEQKEVEVVVQAPTCSFDMERKLASSPGPVRIERADGQFTILGEGFELKQADAVFNISNNVHAILRPANAGALLQSRKP